MNFQLEDYSSEKCVKWDFPAQQHILLMHRSLPSRHLVRSLKCHITGTWAYPLATALSVPGTIQENHRSGVLFLFDADSEGHALKPSLELIVAFLTWVHIRGFGKDYEILRHGEIGPPN